MKAGWIAAAALALLGAAPATAGDAAFGYVGSVVALPTGPDPTTGATRNAFFFFTDGARTGVPACVASNLVQRWAIDTSTGSGRLTANTVMMMQAQGRRIRVRGTGDCGVWGDTETAYYVATE